MAGFSKPVYTRIAHSFVWPAVNEMYKQLEKKMIENASTSKVSLISALLSNLRFTKEGLNISMDGQYDSPGYCAEFCCVASLENKSKKIITFKCVNKRETGVL